VVEQLALRVAVTRDENSPSYGTVGISRYAFTLCFYSPRTILNMERPPAYQPICREEEEEILAQLEEKDGIAWNSNSTEIIPTNTRSFVVYMSIILLSLSANILLVMDNAKLRIAHTPAKSNFSKYTNLLYVLLAYTRCRWASFRHTSAISCHDEILAS
jgi:hypothetical protein